MKLPKFDAIFLDTKLNYLPVDLPPDVQDILSIWDILGHPSNAYDIIQGISWTSEGKSTNTIE